MSSFFDARTRVAASRGHVSHGRLISTTSHPRRRSSLQISRPKRSSAAPPNLTANIFGPLKPERIDRHGEIPPPPFTAITQRKYRMQHNRFHRRASLSFDQSTNNNLKLKR
ncbi:hypothetical protein Bca4012_087320 [Brassica carinata]